MKRLFYITIKAIEPLLFLSEMEFIEAILPDSDVKEHLADKLFTYQNKRGNQILAIMDFYVSLDTEHQIMFDKSVNKLIEETDKRTVQY